LGLKYRRYPNCTVENKPESTSTHFFHGTLTQPNDKYMKTNPVKEGRLNVHLTSCISMRAMLRKRAIEVAVRKGKTVLGVSQADWDQARQELDAIDENLKEMLLESAPESRRWDPLPGSPGHKVAASSGQDTDDEGRSDAQRLVEEGVADAEDDLEHQANRGTSSNR